MIVILLVLASLCSAHLPFEKILSNSRVGTCDNANGFPATPRTLEPFQYQFRTARTATPKLSKCDATGACIDFYEITVRAVNLTVFPGQRQTTWFAYDGEIPGPTFRITKGRQFVVRYINKISQSLPDTNADGVPDIPSGIRVNPLRQDPSAWPISVHLHGSPSIAAYDGWADDVTRSGQFKDYYYPGNHASIEWYHDHAVHVTSINAIMGLAGMTIVYDSCNPYESRLPHEKYDKELLLADRVFDRNNQVLYDHDGPHENNYYGDHIFVNGVAWPTMKVEPRKYRFRLLNVGPSRPYALYLSNGMNLILIGTEGGLLSKPRTASTVFAGVSERFDIIIDFSGQSGKTIFLKNGAISGVPMFCQTHLVMKFEVSLPLDSSIPEYPLPLRLRNERVLSDVISDAALTKALTDFRADVAPTRRFHFERQNGQWVVNGVAWEDEFKRVLGTGITQNSMEVWDLSTGGGWFHPVHIHLVDFLFVDREKYGLMPWEVESAKDVVFLGPGERVRILLRFGANVGDYMFHCHNLVHEDFDMMTAFGVGRAKPIGVSINDVADAQPSATVDPNTADWEVKVPRIDTTNVFKGTPRVPADSKTRNPMFDRAKNLNTMLTPTVNANEDYLLQVLRLKLYEVFYPTNQSKAIPLQQRKCSVENVKSDNDLLCDPYEVDYTYCKTKMFTTANPYITIHPSVASTSCPAYDGKTCEILINSVATPTQYSRLLGLGLGFGGVGVIALAATLFYRGRKTVRVVGVTTEPSEPDVEIQQIASSSA